MVSVVISVLIYGILFKISDCLSDAVGIPYVVTAPVISVFLLVVFCFMNKSGALKKYKIVFPQKINQCLLVSVPLLAIPALNVCLADRANLALNIEVRDIPLVLFWGISAFSEELLFRSVLPSLLSEYCRLDMFRRTAAVNLLFALLHLGNAFMGAPLGTVLVQSVLAMSIGFCFSGITEITESLLPSVCLHWLINLSSLQRDLYMTTLSLKELRIWLGLSVFGFIYGLMLIKNSRR